MYLQRNVEVRSRNHSCSRKAIAIIHSECVSVALVIQHGKLTRRILFLFVPLRLNSSLSTSHKRLDLRKKGY
jgi:hypothetical protein